MKYEILTYGHPVLREKCRRVKTVDAGIRQLASDMLETMYASNGVGLAAQQVGRTESICVIDVPVMKADGTPRPVESEPPQQMPLVLINPGIDEKTGESVCEEGCLSFPEIWAPVKRAEEITVTFTDLDKNTHRIRAQGLLARAIQHELDHLNGKLLVDRMAADAKLKLADRLKRMREAGRHAAEASED